MSSFDRCFCAQRLLMNRFMRLSRHEFFLSSSYIGETCSKRFVFLRKLISCWSVLEFNAFFFNFQKKEPLQAVQVFGKKVCNPIALYLNKIQLHFNEIKMATRGKWGIWLGAFNSTPTSTKMKQIVQNEIVSNLFHEMKLISVINGCVRYSRN